MVEEITKKIYVALVPFFLGLRSDRKDLSEGGFRLCFNKNKEKVVAKMIATSPCFGMFAIVRPRSGPDVDLSTAVDFCSHIAMDGNTKPPPPPPQLFLSFRRDYDAR